MHVEEQRATSHDLQQLPGPAVAAGAGTPTEAPSTTTALAQRTGAPATTVHESYDRRTGHEPAGCHSGSLHRGDHRGCRTPFGWKRIAERLGWQDPGSAREDRDPVEDLALLDGRLLGRLVGISLESSRLTHLP